MLYILDRNEQVVGLLQSNSDRNKNIYYDDVLTEILSSGADTFTFTSIPDRDTSKKLTVGNYIAFKKGNKFKLLQIIEVNESKEDVLTKEIYCEGAGLELINTVYSGSKMDSVNIKRFLINILQDTNWKVGHVSSNLTKTLSLDVKEKEVYSIIQEYLYDFEAEIDFRVEIKGNRIVGRYIDVYSKRGRNNGRRLEINRDIKGITRKVSLANYATKLIGEGKNGLNFRDISMTGTIEKPLGQNFVTNDEAYSRINNKGKHITRKFTYDTEDAYELLRQTHKALKEYSEPKVTYEVDVDILDFDDIEIGDYVSISDLSFTPPLLVTARISELETSKTNKYSNKAVLSNFNEVRSGISSIFPILGEDIVSGSIGEEQMNPDYVDSIISDSVNTTMVKTEILLADKANIKDLDATNATVENLTADFAEIDELLAGNITAENIKADSITSDHIQANTIDTKHLKADSIDANKIKADSIESKHIQSNTIDTNHLKANIIDAEHINANSITSNHIQSNTIDARHINSNSINADHIQANTITSGHIQTGSITAGSGIIADGAIGNAQISQIDAGKIEAGTIDTSKVTIQGANGHLRLKGNRMQVFQGTGNQAKERVSVGDVNGDGTVYGLRVRGADGQTILLDENGVTSEGITDGSITNDKISDDANIDGAKLNINSVVSKINEDGTKTIQGTKIEVDGATLNTKLSTITNKQTEDSERITQAQSQITANTNAIKLKVDEQTYTTDKKDMTSKLEKNTSEISTMKGQIALKVEQADIENAKSEIEGVIDTKVDSAKAEIKITTDAISQNVSNLTQTVSNKADGSTVSSLNSKVSSLETSVNGISGKVTSLEKTTTTLGTQVDTANTNASSALNKANSATTTANNAQNTANTNKSNITDLQGEVSTVKSNVASLEVTTSGISQKVSNVESTTATLSGKVNTANNNATNALNKANSANTLADSKAKVFTSTPTVPYKIGDLWVQGTNGDVMKCKTARTSGSYTASDWEKASKYTDDTKANAVDGKVTTLQGTVNTTNSKVATLETNLNGITQRVSSTESTTATLTTKVNNAQNTADNVSSKLNNLQIGTRNLLKGTSSELKSVTFGGWDYYFPNNLTSWKVGGQLTGRMYIKPTNQEASCMLHVRYTDSTYSQYRGNVIKAGTEGYSTVTITVNPPSGKTVSHIQFSIRHSASNTPSDVVYYKEAKVESGSKATDWSPAPEDVEKQISDVKTEISNTKSKVATIETNLSGITSRVSNVETNQTTTNGKVSSLETRMSTAESKITETAITNTVKKNFYTKAETDSQITSKGYQTSSQVQQTVNGLEIKVKQSGGYNNLFNSGFKKGTSYWSEQLYGTATNKSISTWDDSNQYILPNTKALVIRATNPTDRYGVHQNVKVKEGATYSISALSAGHRNTKQLITIRKASDGTHIANIEANPIGAGKNINNWRKMEGVFTIPSGCTEITVCLYMVGTGNNSDAYVWYTNVLLSEGKIVNEWSPHPSEIYDGVTTIDKDGVTVTASNVKSKTNMSANGFKITKTDTNEDVFKVNSDGTLYMKGSVTVTSGNAKDMVDRVVGWTYSGTTEINGGNIRTGTLSASKITAGTLDASKVTVTNLNASNIKSGKLSANYIDATNLSVKGELLSGQINGIGGMKFADGAVIASYDSHVPGHKGISVSAPSVKLGDKVSIYSPTMYFDVVGKNNTTSATTTWTMSSSGGLNCSTINTSSTTTVGGTLNVRNNMINGMNNLQMGRGSVYIPIFGSSSSFDYIKGGRSTIAFADTGPIHFLYNGSKSSFIAGGTVYLPHAGNVNCDHFRLGAGVMASPSSGSFHFLTASGNTSPLYAGRLYSADVRSASEPMVISNNSAFDKINSVNVIETKNGLNLHNPISTTNDIDESPDVVKTVYNEEKDEIKTSIDYTSAISTLWKAVQELKQENNELKEIIKSLCSKE